ncbi:MAG: hypothetical protein ACFFDN_07795 [Candidatus Hodarchaeota archaeon]
MNTDFVIDNRDEESKISEKPWWDNKLEAWITQRVVLRFDLPLGWYYTVIRYKIVPHKRKLNLRAIELWGEERANLWLNETTYTYNVEDITIVCVYKVIWRDLNFTKDKDLRPEEKVWKLFLADRFKGELKMIIIKISEYEDVYLPLCYYKEEDALKAAEKWLSTIKTGGRRNFLVMGYFRMGVKLGLRRNPKFIEFLNEYMKSDDARNFLKESGKEIKENCKIHYDSKDEIFIYE